MTDPSAVSEAAMTIAASAVATTTTTAAAATTSLTTATSATAPSSTSPPPTRMENTTVCLPVVYGSVAFYLGKKADEYQTHQWTLYLRGQNVQEDLSLVISKVIFQLHPSFAQPVRELTSPPFEVTERGWGEFEAQIKIIWSDTNEQPTVVTHGIKLYPPGTPANVVPTDTSTPVVAESYDEVVFTNPSESFFAHLQQLSRSAVATTSTPHAMYSQQAYFKTFSDADEFTILLEAQRFLQEELRLAKERLRLSDEELKHVEEAIRDMQDQNAGTTASTNANSTTTSTAGSAVAAVSSRSRTTAPSTKKAKTTKSITTTAVATTAPATTSKASTNISTSANHPTATQQQQSQPTPQQKQQQQQPPPPQQQQIQTQQQNQQGLTSSKSIS